MNWFSSRRANARNPVHLLVLLLGIGALLWWVFTALLPGIPGWQPFATPSGIPAVTNLKVGEQGAITGKSGPGAWVCLRQDGKDIGHVFADAQGNFSIPLPAQAAAGTYKFDLVAASDANAIITSAPAPFEVLVEAPVVAAAATATAEPTKAPEPTATSAPAATATTEPTKAPAATATTEPTKAPAAATATAAPTETPAPVGPSITGLDAGSTVIGCDVKELSGTAAANANVEVLDGTRVLGKATADADGKWTLALPNCLPVGQRALSVKSDAGASEPVSVLAVAAPVIAQPRSARPATETPLNGTATAGATVIVTSGDKTICTVTADANGRWTCTLPAEQATSKQTLKVSIVDKDSKAVVDGNQVEVNFDILLPETGGN
jgi:hypothetical protein